MNNFDRTLESLVYVTRQHDGEVQLLLQYRYTDPNKGKWVPIGNLIGHDEPPFESATKTLGKYGLKAEEMLCKGIVTEICPEGKWQCFLFIYVVSSFIGELVTETVEGLLKWFSLKQVEELPKPQADSQFNYKFLLTNEPFYEAAMFFDRSSTLVNVKSLS